MSRVHRAGDARRPTTNLSQLSIDLDASACADGTTHEHRPVELFADWTVICVS